MLADQERRASSITQILLRNSLCIRNILTYTQYGWTDDAARDTHKLVSDSRTSSPWLKKSLNVTSITQAECVGQGATHDISGFAHEPSAICRFERETHYHTNHVTAWVPFTRLARLSRELADCHVYSARFVRYIRLIGQNHAISMFM